MSEAQAVDQPRQAGNVVTSENLTEWTMDRLGLATEEAPVEAEAVEETPESEPTAVEGESEQDSETEGKATEERKQNPKLEKRFSELTKARKLAEETAAKEREQREALEARLKEYEGQSQPTQKQADPIGVEPRPDQFDDAFEYAKALAEWSAEKALYERDQQELNRKAQEERNKMVKSWTEKLEKTKPSLPDFDDVVDSSKVVVNDDIRDAILESDVGPEILYHLASLDEDEADKFMNLSQAKALREIGKLEARFEKQEAAEEPVRSKPVVQKSKAPAPLSPIKATGSAMDTPIGSDGEFHGSFQAWKAARKAGKIR